MTKASKRPIRVLILGTGGMAKTHVEAYQAMEGVTVVAGVDPRAEERTAFCTRHAIGRQHASLDEALAAGGFDAVSNVTPDAVHHQTTLPLLAAGKHVLCEKPLATSAADACAMADAARAAGVVAMVNLSYRNVPALQEAARLIAAGTLGRIRHFEASYLQSWLVQPAWGDWRSDYQWLWRLSRAHGSKGVLGDVGIHILDFASFAIGSGVADLSCRLATFDKAPGNRIGDFTLDANDSVVLHMALQNGALGTVSATRFATGHLNDLRLRVYGDAGGMEVSFERQTSRLSACLAPDLESARWTELPCPAVPTVYERFIAAIRGEGPAEPDFARGAALQAILDAAERSAGLATEPA